jgi:phosphoribosyl 1,2-cyclic phosphodiesterase
MAESKPRFTVRYWGVRGSVATPGPGTMRYGGNTTCIEIRCDDQIFVIDTGTGARELGNLLMAEAGDEPIRATLLYSHHHLDHVQGFPFFVPIYQETTQMEIFSGTTNQGVAEQVLSAQMAYPAFPVGLDQLPSQLNFHVFDAGQTLTFGDVTVRTCPLHHPGGAVSYRIEHRGHAFVQASDVEHTENHPDPALTELCQGADYFSYDSTYVDGPEYERYKGWGHSTWQHGLEIAQAAGVKTFIAFHHDPGHDDAFMDGVAENLTALAPGSLVAIEGMTVDLLTGTLDIPEALYHL